MLQDKLQLLNSFISDRPSCDQMCFGLLAARKASLLAISSALNVCTADPCSHAG